MSIICSGSDAVVSFMNRYARWTILSGDLITAVNKYSKLNLKAFIYNFSYKLNWLTGFLSCMHDYYCVQRLCWYLCAKNNTANFSGYNVSHSSLSSSFSLSEHEPLISRTTMHMQLLGQLLIFGNQFMFRSLNQFYHPVSLTHNTKY